MFQKEKIEHEKKLEERLDQVSTTEELNDLFTELSVQSYVDSNKIVSRKDIKMIAVRYMSIELVFVLDVVALIEWEILNLLNIL